MKYLLGIDIGTTGTKTVLFDELGQAAGSAYRVYEVCSDAPDYAEQEARDWWEAVVQTVREATAGLRDKSEIAALSLSTQGGTLVPVDGNDQPIGRAVSWLDHRPGARELDALRAGKQADYHYLHTGWRLDNCYNLAQILWMRNSRPEQFRMVKRFLSTSDYICLCLTGRAVTDYTSAGITNLEELSEKKWDETIFADLGIRPDQLGELLPAGTPVGPLTWAAADALGLPPTVQVINGGMDQYCGALGAGAVREGDLMLATGTAWVALSTCAGLVFDTKSFFAPCHHILPGKCGLMATVPTGGISLEWFRKTFQTAQGAPESFQAIDQIAAEKPPGASGVLFYPHFSGSTCPTWSSANRASFLGLNLSHDRGHLARAVMEGVAFQTKEIIETMEAGGGPRRIYLIGGAAKSALWSGIVADITGLPVYISRNANAACAGAAMVAGVGAGLFADYASAQNLFCKTSARIEPDTERGYIYQERFAAYQSGFHHLKNFYTASGN